MINKALYSSRSEEWETPQDFFDRLNEEFGFTLDVCATAENAKCEKFFTKEEDGLRQDWDGETCWMNPPYGRMVADWMRKAYQSNATVVALVPARTDTHWFHNWVYYKADLRFVKGRLKFGNSKYAAPFPSLIVIYRPR